jgi:hypothetical protein
MRKLSKSQLRRMIREAMHSYPSSGADTGNIDMQYIYQQIEEKMEHDLLVGIQDQVADEMNDPMGDACDYGALAEDMGYAELMEGVASWFEEYIAACVAHYRG